MILVLGGATLLDDGPFLVVAVVTATVALVLDGGRRLLVAAAGGARRAETCVAPTVRCEPAATLPIPGSLDLDAQAPSTGAKLVGAASD